MLQRDDHDWRLIMPTAVLSAVREAQIPLLALMLLGGCAAKGARVLKSRDLAVGLGPTALFPLRLRRPIAMAMCAAEFGLGIGLILTAGQRGAGLPATIVRAGVCLLFLTAVGALIELRERRPDAGCGCFGELSVTPVGNRTITRSAVLALAAIATVGQPPLRMPASGQLATVWVVALVAELLLLAALSPELGEAMARLGYSEPCEVRPISVDRTLAALAGSGSWRRYARMVTASAPADIWREGCWRYVVYPGETEGRQVDLVFAVSLRSRRPQVRVAMLDAATDEVLSGTPAGRPAPEREAARLGREAARPGLEPVPGRLRPLTDAAGLPYRPDLEVTRPLAGLGARAGLDEQAAYVTSTNLEAQRRLGAAIGVEIKTRVVTPSRTPGSSHL
jgi:hypothetical protein